MFINDKREGVDNFLCDFCQASVQCSLLIRKLLWYKWHGITHFYTLLHTLGRTWKLKYLHVLLVYSNHSVWKLRNDNEVIFPKLLETVQAAPRGVHNEKVLGKYMHQNEKRTPTAKCDFNEFALHLTLLYIFGTPFSKRTSWRLLLDMVLKLLNYSVKYLGETSPKILEYIFERMNFCFNEIVDCWAKLNSFTVFAEKFTHMHIVEQLF